MSYITFKPDIPPNLHHARLVLSDDWLQHLTATDLRWINRWDCRDGDTASLATMVREYAPQAWLAIIAAEHAGECG